jgi:hypothetical protein
MIPVEPEQGNACAGKVIIVFSTFRFSSRYLLIIN